MQVATFKLLCERYHDLISGYLLYYSNQTTTVAEQQDAQEESLLCHQVCNTFIVDIAWFINSFHYNLKSIRGDENCLEICFSEH